VLAWVVGGPPLERMVVTLTVARTELYRAQRDTARRLLRAFLRAVDWIDAHPEDARAMAAARLGITDELGQKIGMLRWPADARVDRRLFAEQQAVLVGAGLLARVVPAEAVVDESVLEEVLGERR
jgi:ABC-type nitrate/sulfonate/bicarbonate transport system substrate-binding protein